MLINLLLEIIRGNWRFTMLVNVLLEIRGKLILAGGLGCWLSYHYRLGVS